jgi:hypothetical protein
MHRVKSRAASAALVLCAAVLVAGCETPGGGSGGPGATAPSKAPAPAPAPRFNLSGYPAGFKEGYADACASPRRRNAERFKSDTQYSMGWQDGQSACRAK